MCDPSSLAMSRLFEQLDIEFLRSVPGYTRRVETAFRRRRCRIFRGYLRNERAELEEILAEFDTPASTLSAMHYRLEFACALIPAYARLFRYRWVWGTVQLRDVLLRFDALLAEVRLCIPQVE
jgi:hypothetical protein